MIFQSFFNVSVLSGVYESKKGAGKTSLILSLNAFVALGVLVYLCQGYVFQKAGSVNIFFISIGLFIVWYLIKAMLSFSVGIISEEHKAIGESVSYSSIYYQVLGVLLIPGLLYALLTPENILGFPSTTPFFISNLGLFYCFFMMGILYLFRLLQSFRQSRGVNISWYYIILYLCTLEILPLVVMYHLLVGNISGFN